MFAFDFIFPNVYTHSKTVKDFRFSVQDLYNHIFTWEKLRGFIVIMEWNNLTKLNLTKLNLT